MALFLIALIGFTTAPGAVSLAFSGDVLKLGSGVEPTGTPIPGAVDYTPHTAEPYMTGEMPGMEDMPGTATRPAQTNSGPTTAIAIAGLVLLTALVAGAIVIEQRRRLPPGGGPSGTAND